MMGRRLTQNEIIQARRRAERGYGRVIKGALMLLPRPVRRWVVLRLAAMFVRAMKRRGYTTSDVMPLFEDASDNARRKRDSASE
jgi:hypothetical protein